MKIYFGHSREFDYENEYYKPIENSKKLQGNEMIFPHKVGYNNNHTRDFYSSLDLFIAEVSYSAIGLGIELGWAKDDNVPIYCFYKKGFKVSSSLRSVSDYIIEYDSLEELTTRVEEIVNDLKIKK